MRVYSDVMCVINFLNSINIVIKGTTTILYLLVKFEINLKMYTS